MRRGLLGSVTENMDARRYELVTIAAARKLGSTYCTLAHGKVLLDRFLDAGQLHDAVLDHHAANLDGVDVAVMDLAEKVADDATAVIPADVERLRELGLTDAEILDVVLAAAVRCFYSKTLDALCVQADAVYNELEPALRETLTVGRPIADD
jgi:alkylhydroperoxidase family enzyme